MGYVVALLVWRLQTWICSECEVMDDTWYVYMPGQPLLLHKPRCPQFLHSSCNGLFSACQVKHPCHIPLFLYLMHPVLSLPSSCLHQLLPLSVPCLTPHQKVLHILHLSTVTFCTLPLVPLQTFSERVGKCLACSD